MRPFHGRKREAIHGLSLVVGAVCLMAPVDSDAQAPSASVYPSDPSAAVGMTSGLPGGTTADQAALMQSRSAAMAAQGDAAAASMARSADQALENQQTQRALQDAREIKAIKMGMIERMKWERANQGQVDKVTSREMSTWKTNNGNVKVEREVPDPFLQALIAQEGAEKPKKEKKGFSLNPFKKDEPDPAEELEFLNESLPGLTTPGLVPDQPSAAAAAVSSSGGASEAGNGFLSGLKMPKIGGSKKDNDLISYTGEPQFVGSGAAPTPTASVGNTAPSTNTVVSARSGNALLDETAPEATASTTLSFNDGVEPEKKGLFSKFKSDGGGSQSSDLTPSSSGGGGFLGFGKKKSDASIDGALFPDDVAGQAPTSASLQGGYTVDDVAEDASFAPSSTGDIVMPGAAEKKNGFNLSMPEISMPSLSLSGLNKDSNKSGGSVPTLTTINSAGTDYYVVNATAQFLIYGDEQVNSEVKALRAGTVVRMTKPGEQWASVRLPDGSEGVIQNKFLRAASSAEAGGQFSQ